MAYYVQDNANLKAIRIFGFEGINHEHNVEQIENVESIERKPYEAHVVVNLVLNVDAIEEHLHYLAVAR